MKINFLLDGMNEVKNLNKKAIDSWEELGRSGIKF
jgi:hypothetical protein